MNEKTNAPNSACCGRPMQYAPEPKCNYNDCCLNEYKYKMPACIRNKQPDCLAQAVIPSITVETKDGIMNLANCFVHVSNINTTFYIDDKHRPMLVWSGNVETELPEDMTSSEIVSMIIANDLGLRSQHAYYRYLDTDSGIYKIVDFYYDRTGKVYFAGEFEEVLEEN